MEKETTFGELGLGPALLKALTDVGYEAPTPIQAETIPALLSGRDIIGQAQTGTGKTAAFALPILEKIDHDDRSVQCLVLVPTRELALQVGEALHTYSRHMRKTEIMAIYGGQPFTPQLKSLKKGLHVVVGTPGRVMDHMRRESLSLSSVKTIILDEADEMLRMGFAEDVEWILARTPQTRQTALFTATMPPRIRSIASNYLKDPVSVHIAQKTLTVPTVEQYYINLSERQKLDALTRLLMSEPVEAALVFARTRTGASELAEKLFANGIQAEALHGDMSQAAREVLLRRFRAKKLTVLVATDVAARGLDVEHISHVINYDIPNDVEAYVHRIGRTGRAGRSGVAVLFATPRERRMLKEIERYTGQRMSPRKMPTRADMAARTVAVFKESIKGALSEPDMDLYLTLVEEIAAGENLEMAELAAAAVKLALGERKLEITAEQEIPEPPTVEEKVRLFISVGSKAGVRPADIVGALANEAGVPGKSIGAIDIYERFTFVEVPAAWGSKAIASMTGSTIRGREVRISAAAPDRAQGAKGKPGAEPAREIAREEPKRRPGPKSNPFPGKKSKGKEKPRR